MSVKGSDACQIITFSQSLQPVCLYTFSYTPHKELTELASSPDGN